MKAALALLLLLGLVGCASTRVENRSRNFTQLPPELTAVNWKQSPRDILANASVGEPLVWVGLVKEVLVYRNAGSIEIDWVCQHLRFIDAGPAAITKRPITVREGTGVFGVSLVVEDMPIDEAKKFQVDHTHVPHYLLVGGTLAAVRDWKGEKIPFVKALRMALGPQLVSLSE